MSVEDNKAAEQRIFDELFNNRNVALIDELYSPDWVYHGGAGIGDMGLEGFKQMVAGLAVGFPDFHMTVNNMIAEGDKVVCHYTLKGTHQGEFMGIPLTGKQVTVQTIIIARFANGKQVELWSVMDQLGMMQQLGVVPSQ